MPLMQGLFVNYYNLGVNYYILCLLRQELYIISGIKT